MEIVVLANQLQRAELAKCNVENIIWVEDEQALLQHSRAAAYIDLNYCNTPERNALLRQLLPKVVIINSVVDTLRETNLSFIRINGWETFLSSPIIEAAINEEGMKNKAEEILSSLNKKIEWLADEPGFVTPRIVSMIVNEAYIALNEEVSTKEEIDTAMKLGTAYPYGPFQWSEEIGIKKIITLLQKLTETGAYCNPSKQLLQEVNKTL